MYPCHSTLEKPAHSFKTRVMLVHVK